MIFVMFFETLQHSILANGGTKSALILINNSNTSKLIRNRTTTIPRRMEVVPPTYVLLPSSQIIGHFGCSRYIAFVMHLYTRYVSREAKMTYSLEQRETY
jgi:hypothetical protein